MSPTGSRAWGWVAHLRSGGTTPWTRWSAEAPATARVLPGAQQLELLRRLNLAGPVPPGLAERVLVAPASGRGKPDLPLAGDLPHPVYGPQPVDPAELPADELVRVATSLLAEDLVALGVPAPAAPRPRPWRRHYRFLGDPLLAASHREHLVSRGRPPGGRGGQVLVLAGPLDRMLADTWTRRCFERGSGAWPQWLRFWRERGELPPRIDLPRAIEALHRRRELVRVVTDQQRLPGLLGVASLPPVRRPGADAAELARRIAGVTGLLAEPQHRADLMSRTLWPRMPATGTAPVAVPAEHREWLERCAARMARQLRRAGYPVVGDLAALAPSGAVAAPGDLDAAVLALAVRMLVDPSWKELA